MRWKYEDSWPNIVLIRLWHKRRYVGCPLWKKFNISKYITSSSRRRSAIQNSIIWYAAKSGEKAAMGWKWFLGWAPRWGSIEGEGEGTVVTDGMSRTDGDIIHYNWPTGFLYRLPPRLQIKEDLTFYGKSIAIDTTQYIDI